MISFLQDSLQKPCKYTHVFLSLLDIPCQKHHNKLLPVRDVKEMVHVLIILYRANGYNNAMDTRKTDISSPGRKSLYTRQRNLARET
jgi:hypothetical protein